MQIDEEVSGCEGVVFRVSELKRSYETTLDKFKLTCADAEVIPAENYSRASLEQCITALRIHVGSGDQLSVCAYINNISFIHCVRATLYAV